eukprot:CAMPEP_0194047826 /NCGR_PEP_ID=MMETSP0009_2-20130614/25698_1 /TAXON_ID=210454 /ORGANISM="Grammatophora oceanica, Strain CCMP 410" /LENGTH=275 /DNA_ID=CAMNT_0038693545 /DNA_START=43 /DNA_END=870 /DNA_ORIENTATION=+
MPALAATSLPTLTYPRTGKRGVPQQFPRRLYEMLEGESKLASDASTSFDHQTIITWSETGKAFRIIDVAVFADQILPKYFRTSKFSSFQRNLNLYGFSKVRGGPDSDMYHHPVFQRGKPENLAQLRKCNSAAARKRLSVVGSSIPTTDCLVHPLTIVSPSSYEPHSASRAVSPTPSPPRVLTQVFAPIVPLSATNSTTATHQVLMPPMGWPNFAQIQIVAQPSIQIPPPTAAEQEPPKPASPSSDSGRLDLLAMAMTSLAEREGAVSQTAAPQHA